MQKNHKARFVLAFIIVVVLLTGCTKQKVEPTFHKEISYNFTYIDSEGNLRVKNLAEGRDDILIRGEFIFLPYYADYEVNWVKQLVAYVWNDGELDREFVLYNMKTHERTVLSENAHIGLVSWSPNHRYLLLDVGTYVWRKMTIYDAETNALIPINFFVYSGPRWSPNGNRLAVGIEEEVWPETPVSDGESVTTVILDVADNLAMSTVVQGTSEYNSIPFAWMDENTLVIEKYYFNDYIRMYEKIDLGSQKSEEFLEDIQTEVSLYSYSLSSDNKYMLYEKDGEILLKSMETKETVVVGEGFIPKW